MNPIKADKIQFGTLANQPHVRRGTTNNLVLYDASVGEVALSSLVSERAVENVVTVSKSSLGTDFASIQDAINFLPSTGGVVIVYGGEYSESISVSKQVTLIARGAVSITSTDAPCVSLSGASFYAQGVGLRIIDLVGNNTPSIIEATTADTAHEIKLDSCSFDTTAHATASFLSSNLASVYLTSCVFKGEGSVDLTGALTCRVEGAVIPNVELTNMLSLSYLSGTLILDVTLVGSSLAVSGNMNSVIGDVGSTLLQKVTTGSVDFDNSAQEDVTFTCPLSSASYVLSVEPNSQGDMPVISNRTQTGFTLTYGAPISDTIRWSAQT